MSVILEAVAPVASKSTIEWMENDENWARNEGPPHEAYVPLIPDPWDTQVGGEHYKLPIQPLQYALANDLGIMEHAVVKYTTRHEKKGGAQDIRKGIDYLIKILKHKYNEDY